MRKRYTLKVNEADDDIKELEDVPFLYEKTFENVRASSVDNFIENNGSLLEIIENVPNGVAIVSTDLKIEYVNRKMRKWFNLTGHNYNKKCYRMFHGKQKSPCRECPAKVCMETKSAASVVHYCGPEGSSGKAMYIHLHAFPILNEEEEVVAFVEYAYNLTELRGIMDQLKELKSRVALLESENALLHNELDKERNAVYELEKTVSDNIKNYVKPVVDYLGTRVSREEQKIFTSLIEEAVYPITKTRSARGIELSSRELEVAMMIKEGRSSKQIAEELFITKKAVDYHRANIRKKLGIDTKENLQTYLRAYI